MIWPVLFFALALITVGLVAGYMWWGVAYHELRDELEDREYASRVMRGWDQ
jgi:hypothetical protein